MQYGKTLEKQHRKLPNIKHITLCDVSLEYIPESSILVVAAYNGGVLDSCETRVVTTKKTESFTVNKNADIIKVFVFDSETNIVPLTECEVINV